MNLNPTLLPYINGRFESVQKSDWTTQIPHPAQPNATLATLSWKKEFVSVVVEGVLSAQKFIAKKEFGERLETVKVFIALLKNRENDFKKVLREESGRCAVSVNEEWKQIETFWEGFEDFCRSHLSTKTNSAGWAWNYSPAGAVLAAGTFSLPLYTCVTTTLISFITGNPICFRASSHAPLSAALFADCVHQASLPSGLFQLVYGDFEVFRRLIQTRVFKTVYFTGSEELLERVKKDTQQVGNVRLVCKSKSKSAVFVCDSADLQKTVHNIVYSSTVDSGQRLESAGIVFVTQKRLDEVRDATVKALKEVPIAFKNLDADSRQHSLGPLCSQNAVSTFLRFQSIAARECQETLRWGKTIGTDTDGYFVSPGVHQIQPESFLKSVYALNSFFGPDICFVGVERIAEAVSLFDQVNVGRVVSVCSNFEEEFRTMRKISRVPVMLFNSPTTLFHPEVPFLGFGISGNSFDVGSRFLSACVYPQVLKL